MFGVTADPAGSNLPAQYGPWAAFKTLDFTRDVPTPGLNTNECLDDIEKHGLHVTDAHVRITQNVI